MPISGGAGFEFQDLNFLLCTLFRFYLSKLQNKGNTSGRRRELDRKTDRQTHEQTDIMDHTFAAKKNFGTIFERVKIALSVVWY